MRKYLPVIITAFIWIWASIFVKILSYHFDNPTQNFYRYLAASIILVIVSTIFYKKEFLKAFKDIKKFIFPAILIVVFQLTWVGGLYHLTPTVAVLIGKSEVLFVILFSFIFFHDERNIIKSKSFIFGSLLAVIGVSGVILGKNNLHLTDFNLGAIMILIASILWAIYMIAIKKVVIKTDPFIASSVIYTLSIPLFFIIALLFGDLPAVHAAPKGIIVILFLSGAFCVGIANAFNFKSIKLIGTSLSTTFILIAPFFTGIASYFILKEILTIYQILFGIILIIGCALLIRAGNRFPTK